MHRRTKIRNKLADVIKAALPSISVRTNSLYLAQTLPAVHIKAAAESINLKDSYFSGVVNYAREFDITVEITAADRLDVSEVVDSLCEKIEKAIEDNSTLGGLCSRVIPQSTEFDFDSGDNPEIPMCQAILTFRVYYSTPANDPT